jgi:hypothetical protein
MSLTIEEIEAEILILPEQEQLKLIDFVESLKRKFKSQAATKTEGEKIGLIECSENENSELSANYKDYLWGSEKPNKPLKLGLFKGEIKMADDFNEPLPDSFWLEGKL